MKTSTAPLPPLRSVKVLDQLRERIRYLHYSLRTEQAYVHWGQAFIRFNGVRHPATLGGSEVEAFLSWLANERKISTSTHRQALAALLFFYGKVLCVDLPWLQEIGRPRPSRRLPVVRIPDEVIRILGHLEGKHRLFAQLPYGTGMRTGEGLQLRVKDLDFDHGTIIVREGKGSKDRALMFPESHRCRIQRPVFGNCPRCLLMAGSGSCSHGNAPAAPAGQRPASHHAVRLLRSDTCR